MMINSKGAGYRRRTGATLSALLVWLLVSLLGACAEGTALWNRGPERPLWGSGSIEGTNIIVSAEVGGQVRSLHAAAGDFRDAGDRLISLDPTDLEIERSMREIDVAMARTELQLLDVGARTEDLRRAEAALRRAERELSAARDDYDRMERLLAGGSVTRGRYENAELALSRAQTEYVSAEQELERLSNLVRPEEYELALLRAERAERGRQLADRQVNRASVRAPRPGHIDQILVEAGEFVRAGQAVVRMVRRDPAWITVYIRQTELAKVSVDDVVEVLVDAYPGRRFEGRVVRVAEEAEFTPGNVQTRDERARLVFAVKAEIANRDGLLRPGMGAEVEFPRAARQEGRP